MRSCPTVDSGGDGVVGGMPQLLSGSVVVGNSGTGLLSAKIQPSVVSMVVVVERLIGRAGLLGVFLVELADDVW